jgi:hypothetical protein
MQRAGEPSWRLSATDGHDLDLLLWFRDALGLVAPGDDVPPRAVPRPPDRSGLLADDARAAAAGRWAVWWRAAVAFAGEGHLVEAPAGAGPFLAWVRERGVVHEAIGAPPGFAALGDVPALRAAVARLFPDARRDLSGREAAPAGALPRRVTPDDHRELAVLAADVARAHGVGTGAVRGAVLVVAVAGPWWRLVGPGVVVCSPDYRDDAAFAAEVVRAAFASGVARA